MIRIGLLALLAVLSAIATAGAQMGSTTPRAPDGVVAVAAEGTQFRLTLTDGRVLRSPDLVGATLVVAVEGRLARVRLTTVERDPNAKSGDVWLHTMMVEQRDGTLINLCKPGPDGREQGFPLASRRNATGGTENTPAEQFEIICSAGARAKCVRFGYRPWVAEEEYLYNSCTRMVRADYCGDGEGTTRDGMSIDLYDDKGIQRPDMAAHQAFEAGWTPDGAVCVSHVRVSENTSLPELAAACPRLAARVGPVCTEQSARDLGARLFNRSTPRNGEGQ